MPIPYDSLFKFGFLAGPVEETGQGQNRARLRVGAVSMEMDAVWSLQCHGYISTVDGTCIDRCDKEVWQSGNVLIATPTLEDQIERLDEVFACMKMSGLKCKP